jgi:hypothetical protein
LAHAVAHSYIEATINAAGGSKDSLCKEPTRRSESVQ